jgi:hypothetical protein
MAGILEDFQSSVRDVPGHLLRHGDIGNEVVPSGDHQRWDADLPQLWTQVHDGCLPLVESLERPDPHRTGRTRARS